MKIGTIAILIMGAVWIAARLGNANIEADMSENFQAAVVLYKTKGTEMNRFIPAAVEGCLAGQSASQFPSQDFEVPSFVERFYVQMAKFTFKNADLDKASYEAKLARLLRKNQKRFDGKISKLSASEKIKLEKIKDSINSKSMIFFGCIARYTLLDMNRNT